MASLYAEDPSQIDVRTYPAHLRRRFELEVDCLGGDGNACLSLLTGYGIASKALPQPGPSNTALLGQAEELVSFDVDCSAALARSACAKAGTNRSAGCLWQGLLSIAMKETPSRVMALWHEGCQAGSESACAGELALKQPAEATSRWCANHLQACESLWQLGRQSLGSSMPDWWKTKSTTLLDDGAGSVAAVLARAALNQNESVLSLATDLGKPCTGNPARCRETARGHLDPMERLALHIALCRNGDARSCRFAAMRLGPETPPKTETVVVSKEMLERGCKLGDRLTCAYLGANLLLPDAGLPRDPERGRTLLREACSAPEVDCYQSIVANEQLGLEDRPNQMTRMTDPRFGLLQQAACAFGSRPAHCEELAEQSLDSDQMVVDRLTLAEASCRSGSAPHCQEFLQTGNNEAKVGQLCKAGNGAACESLIWTAATETNQLAYATRACELGLCSTCQVLSDRLMSRNSSRLVELLKKQCSKGCVTACGILVNVYENGAPGIRPNEDRAAQYRQRCYDLEMSEH